MIKIFACGDIVNYNNVNCSLLSPELEEIVKAADYSVFNFEAPIQGVGTPQLKSGPHHAQRPKTLEGLKVQGFDLALLANNHIFDYGYEGLNATINLAHKCGLETIGAGLDKESAYAPMIKKLGGMKIGIINACEAQFGVINDFDRVTEAGFAWVNSPVIDQTILDLKVICDFVLVFAHAGLENYPIPLKEWRARYRHFCDLGADAIICSHPHVPQGIEEYGSSLIFYSLGNFYFDGGRSANSENQSFAVLLKIEKNLPISFEPVYHYTSNGLVDVARDNKKIDLDYLSKLLNENYYQEHEVMVMEAYNKFKKQLVCAVTDFPIDTTVKGTIRELLNKVLGRPKALSRELAAMHLIRNEAYYYVTRNALEIKVRRGSLK
ncbi:CapA family protein [Pseudoalteromonas sp. SR43-2]|uniref:CapA family protein n=1 Tax=Pseudoalteromonas sp. SR43-2 TaxID=2760944 RepID=UPI0015FA57F1|nr:CapA family protein [Pseudoalteromonas sp. SR43-2]MBB1379347.1 CapA family protein [Pseudoalteromonas sp. SR43-2]